MSINRHKPEVPVAGMDCKCEHDATLHIRYQEACIQCDCKKFEEEYCATCYASRTLHTYKEVLDLPAVCDNFNIKKSKKIILKKDTAFSFKQLIMDKQL